MKITLFALTLALALNPILSQAQVNHSIGSNPPIPGGEDENDEYNFLNEEPNGLFECFDSVNDFGHFKGLMNDPDYKSLPTISVDNESMPVTQKMVIKSVTHGAFNSEYVIKVQIKSDSECIFFSGKGLTHPLITECNSDFFAIAGSFEIHLQPIMPRKGPIAKREEDQGKTLATYLYSKDSPDLNSKGMLKCVLNAANMRKLMK